MELYEYARPELMSGKKILYVHGFASSGASGTVKTMQLLLPQANIIAPDLPIEPEPAMALLRSVCEKEQPDLIVGTSMGGMYAEQLYGFDRILVNPAFTLADTILKNNGLGRQEFHSPRADGQKDFLVTKGLLESYRECTSKCFQKSKDADEQNRVYGLFGLHDTMVNTFDLFAEHYPNAIHFDGEHYLNDSTFLHSVLPVIQWIDDMQEGRKKQVSLVEFADTLAYIREGGIPAAIAVNSAVKSFHRLCRDFNVFVLAEASPNNPSEWAQILEWVESNLGVAAWNRVIIGNHKDLLMGDYLIDAHPDRFGGEDFLGTVIPFASEHFKTWEDVITYFDRLQGKA